MKEKKQPLKDGEVRVIKISEDALLEFIYEKIVDDHKECFGVDALSVTNSFYIDWENRRFIACAYKSENASGEPVDLEMLAEKLADTTESMYAENRYKTFTKKELEDICKQGEKS